MQRLSRIFAASVTIALISATPAFAQTAAAPTLTIVSPQEGQTIYGDRVPILFSAENFGFVDFITYTNPVPGQGHIHVWLDDQNPTRDSAKKVIEDNTIYQDVPPGDHTLRAELVNNNHTSLTPAQVATVNFKTAPVGSPAPAPTPTFDKNTAIVIFVVVALVIIAAWWYTKEDEDELPKAESAPRKSSSRKRATRSRRK